MRYHSDSPEKRIRELENELWIARETLINLLPDKLHTLLNSFEKCKTKEEASQWMKDVIEKILIHVKTDPFDSRSDRSRACCPLCGSGTEDRHGEKGFAFPTGLRRHLTGFGNTTMCPVMRQVGPHAKEHWEELFTVQERLKRKN